MVASLDRRAVLFCLAVYVLNAVAFPNPSRLSHADDTSHHTGEIAAKGSLLETRMDGVTSAVLEADIPPTPQQSQDITTTEGQGQSGVIPHLSITREEVNCTNLSTGRDNKCWKELGLTDWVADWIFWNTCYEKEPLSSCFLRKNGYPELDCTGIKLDTCTPPPVKDGMDPRVFYVAYNFYGMFSLGSVAICS